MDLIEHKTIVIPQEMRIEDVINQALEQDWQIGLIRARKEDVRIVEGRAEKVVMNELFACDESIDPILFAKSLAKEKWECKHLTVYRVNEQIKKLPESYKQIPEVYVGGLTHGSV